MCGLLENARADKFSLHGEQFDQSRFVGRVAKFVNQVDPRTLLPTSFFGLSLQEAQNELRRFEERAPGWDEVPDDKLWTARKIVRSSIHPDSKEVILPPFRMSGFVPFGTPIVVGMLLANSPAQNAFWQWLNQTHNALVNYSNRNVSAPVTNGDLALSYTVAVGSAVSISIGMGKLVARLQAPALKRFVPFIAVASANIMNVGMMRRMELQSGISVFNGEGKALGQSVEAARKALFETAVTRVVLPVPILVMSPMLLMVSEKVFPVIKTAAAIRIPLQSSFVTLTFLLGLPLSLAMFQEIGEIQVSSLEPNIRDAAGSSEGIVFYNKGL